MSNDKKSFTGWMERPVWERAVLAILIVTIAIVVFILLARNR